MPSTPTRHRTLLAVLVALALVAVPVDVARAVTVPQPMLELAPVSTRPVATTHALDWVGVRFDLPPGTDRHDVEPVAVAVRLRHDGVWGPWVPVAPDGAQAAGRWTGALVPAGGAEAYQVRGLPPGARNAHAAGINTTDGPRVVVAHRRPGVADAATPCRSRADWGANEELRSGTRAHAPVQVLTVHHTAGSTEAATADPDATVRAIYEWHTSGNGWDDIGYQALVSPDGTWYEGRWSGRDSTSCLTAGGDGRDFGHETADEDAAVVTGAHTGGYNTGNVGIALLGTYTDAAPSAAARDTLVRRLADLAGRHHLDPQGTVDYDNGSRTATVDAISGHRDFGATECPGGVLYADLPSIRADVATALATPTDDGAVARSASTAAGTVTGAVDATHTADGRTQAVTEEVSGGRPDRRRSLLEHTWSIEVGAGTPTLHVVASSTVSGDGDDFAFTVSTDDGASWSAPVLTVPAGANGQFAGTLPAWSGGTLLVRVTDTDRTHGSSSLDTIAVDHLVLRLDEAAPPPPPPSADLVLQATGRKEKGGHVVDLTWTSGTTVTVQRDGRVVATATGSLTDRIGAKGAATYTYVVCEVADPATCSAAVTVSF